MNYQLTFLLSSTLHHPESRLQNLNVKLTTKYMNLVIYLRRPGTSMTTLPNLARPVPRVIVMIIKEEKERKRKDVRKRSRIRRRVA